MRKLEEIIEDYENLRNSFRNFISRGDDFDKTILNYVGASSRNR